MYIIINYSVLNHYIIISRAKSVKDTDSFTSFAAAHHQPIACACDMQYNSSWIITMLRYAWARNACVYGKEQTDGSMQTRQVVLLQ